MILKMLKMISEAILLCQEEKLKKLDRFNLAQDCFNFIKTRAYLDLNGWPDIDIFEH